jgi:hypothetical protein
MNAPTFRIPESVAGDSSDVAVVLEVASALWDKGEGEEAIRWLRRAVASASDADDAVRAAGLAGAAADLEEEMKVRHRSVMRADGHPPEPLAEPTPAAADSAPGAPEVPPVLWASEAAHANLTAATESAPMAPIADLPEAAAVTAFGVPAWAAGAAAVGTFSSEASADLPAIPASSTGAVPTISTPPRPPSGPWTASILPSGTPLRSSSVPAPRSNFTKPPSFGPNSAIVAPPVLPMRLRVSVKSSVRDSALLFVRPLADGELAPPGTLEAVLVRVDSDAESEARRNANGSAER